VDFEVEPGGFHVPEAHLPPTGDGHVLDQRFFGRGLRLVFLLIGSEEVDESFARFVFEDDGFREDAVTETVARGGEFALRGDGATGFGAVGAGGEDAAFGTHTMPYFPWPAGGFWGLAGAGLCFESVMAEETTGNAVTVALKPISGSRSGTWPFPVKARNGLLYMISNAAFDRTVESGKCGGKACIRGMRITVRRLLEIMATYREREDIFREYPFLEEEDLFLKRKTSNRHFATRRPPWTVMCAT
jgi:hypothetical protein